MENLGIDTKLIVAQIVNFAIFYFVFRQFIAQPLFKYLNNQKEQEEMREKLAQDLENRKATLEEKDRKLEKERKKELDKALKQAKLDAEEVKQEMVEEAKKEAAKIVADAREQIEEEKRQMYKEMRNQIAEVSSLVVRKALNQYLTDDAQKAITQNIISHIPEESKLRS